MAEYKCFQGEQRKKYLNFYHFRMSRLSAMIATAEALKILKGGIRKRNKAPYLVKGFRLFEKVKYHGKQYFIFGRRSNGFFDIRTLDGTKVIL